MHIIHKLTKDIAQLRRRKSKTEAEKGKNERKAGRFVQEVQVLRKEAKDLLARHLVAHHTTLEELTRQEAAAGRIDLRLRVVVRVGDHRAVRCGNWPSLNLRLFSWRLLSPVSLLKRLG